MELGGRTVALYGRFSAGLRDRLRHEIVRRGGAVTRDLTRRCDALVIGARATKLIDSGALTLRLRAARGRGAPIHGESSFAAALWPGEPARPATLPLTTALSQTGVRREDADLLAAFDLILLANECCRFADASVIRAAGDLAEAGRSRGEIVQILAQARDTAPLGRHRIVMTPSGAAALQWQDGLSTLDGQGHLPLEEDNASLEDLFESAALAEANGEFDEAARLYDICARADRTDAIALYNLANIRLAQGALDEAKLAYQRALARDPRFAEARYNLAQALEASGDLDAAASELDRLLEADPLNGDAVFNLAQLRMNAGEMATAKALYDRYLALDPPDDWAATARKAILYCTAGLTA